MHFMLFVYYKYYLLASTMGFDRRVRSLDIFKKIPKDISRSTNLGGAISLLTLLSILFLIFKEVGAYLHPEYIAQINNDKFFTRE